MSHTTFNTHLPLWSVVAENRYLKYTAITLISVLAFLEFSAGAFIFFALMALMGVALHEQVKNLEPQHVIKTNIADKEKFFDGGVSRKSAGKPQHSVRAIVKDGGSFERS